VSRALFRGATLLDTGPLVAWFDRSDQDHEACAGFFQRNQGAFVSTWPVLTEVCHLIPADLASRFLSWVSLGGLHLAELDGSALGSMVYWMRQYGDLPMDLADASLLWVAQEHGIRRIATLDRRDFGIYRLPGGESLDNLLNP
jgi:predicted nucleic acid-binding protein